VEGKKGAALYSQAHREWIIRVQADGLRGGEKEETRRKALSGKRKKREACVILSIGRTYLVLEGTSTQTYAGN